LSKIVVLDFGSQYTQLIARRIRELGVYCEIQPYDIDLADLERLEPKGLVLSGGPGSAGEEEAPRPSFDITSLGMPVLAVCYGMQLLAESGGGSVTSQGAGEYGFAQVRRRRPSRLLDRAFAAGGGDSISAWMSHGDTVSEPPGGFEVIAASEDAIAAMADESRALYALQFHPEVGHTPQGTEILSEFAHGICGCGSDWDMPHFVEEEVGRICEQVGSERVILAMSGGVDSTVAAALLGKAIGPQLVGVFVDHGLLRLDEGDEVERDVSGRFGFEWIRVDARERMFAALAGISDPEEKRRTIGRVFVEVFEEEAAKRADVKWLAQGTIYPDVIESAGAKTGKARSIKSHHNVGGLPERMKLSVIEPLRELFKDEVRRVGMTLGLPEALVNRHPFPGPGLGVRVIGEVTAERADVLRRADAIFLEELRAAGLYGKVAQAFAALLPVRSVGVMGDKRTYEGVIALRSVDTDDFMTADWSRLPADLLARVSTRIINEVRGVNRVVYDISSKPPSTVEWE